MTASSFPRYAYEDLTPGTRIPLGPYPVSAEEIIEFASEFDPQPMHTDKKAGEASLLGGLAASGWHTSSMVMRMFCDAYLLDSTSQGSPGVDSMQWKRPVLAGDTLHGHSEITAARPSKSRPGLGIISVKTEIYNQRDELVCACQNSGFMGMRERPAT